MMPLTVTACLMSTIPLDLLALPPPSIQSEKCLTLQEC